MFDVFTCCLDKFSLNIEHGIPMMKQETSTIRLMYQVSSTKNVLDIWLSLSRSSVHINGHISICNLQSSAAEEIKSANNSPEG